MSLLQEMKNEQAYLKASLYGLAGSGKTFSASKMAIGLAKHLEVDKIAFFETETGSNYVQRALFEPADIKLIGVRSKAFKDCITTIKECEEEGLNILIIDSISHVWTELIDAYKRKKKVQYMMINHWMNIKQEWRALTDIYLSSKVHIFMCGRAGYEYNYFENEDGKKELEKTGLKMKAETEMGYEPSLIIRMERQKQYEDDGKAMKQEFKRVGHIEKDRYDVIDGLIMVNPDFKDIFPHVKCLDPGGKHTLPDPSRTSDDLITDRDFSAEERRNRYKKVLGEISSTFDKYIPGHGKEEKKAKVEISEKIFGVKSWAAIEQLELKVLEGFLEPLEEACKKFIEPKKAEKEVK